MTQTAFYSRISRRTFISAIAAGAGLLTLPWSIRYAIGGDSLYSAIAFDGDALIVAHGTLIRKKEGETWASLPISAEAEGEVTTLTTHPALPGRIIAGLTTGGIAISEDGGHSWTRRGQDLPKAVVTAATVAAGNPDTLYAAIRGDGLWQSNDAGRSWTFAMDRPWLTDAEHDLTALASVDLATGMGGIWIYAGTETGVTRVPDCFCRWQDVQSNNAMDALVSETPQPKLKPLPDGEAVIALISAVSHPSRLYAALPSGIWVSDDAGLNWSNRTSQYAMALAVHPVNSNFVVAGTGNGLIQSNDGGLTWTAY